MCMIMLQAAGHQVRTSAGRQAAERGSCTGSIDAQPILGGRARQGHGLSLEDAVAAAAGSCAGDSRGIQDNLWPVLAAPSQGML